MKVTLVETKSQDNKPTLYRGSDYVGVGLPRMAGLLREDGHDVKVISEHLTNIDEAKERKIAESDVVGFKTISYSIRETYERAKRIKEYNPETKVVLGGPHATFSPDEALNYGDFVIRGAGDYVLRDLIRAIKNRDRLKKILGLSFWTLSGKPQYNPNRSYMTQQELENLPITDWSTVKDLRPGLTISLTTAAGCNYNCEFCEVVRMFGRPRVEMRPERAILEFENLVKYKPKTVMLADDSLGQPSRSNPNSEDTKKLYRMLDKKGIILPQMAQMNVRTAANDLELLKILHSGGVFLVLLGLEPKNGRPQSLKEIEKGINNLEKAGILVNGMTIYGLDIDTPKGLEKISDFFMNSNLSTGQVTLRTAYKGTRLYERLEKEDKIFDHNPSSWDTGLVTNFSEMISPSQLQEATDNFYKKFYTGKSLKRRLRKNRRKFIFSLPRKSLEGLRIVVKSSKRWGIKYATRMAILNTASPFVVNFFLKRGNKIFKDWEEWEIKSGYLDRLKELDKEWERKVLR